MTPGIAGWREGGWAGLGQAATVGSAVLRGMLLARLLTTHDLGRLFLLISAANVVATISQGGVGVVGLRHLAAADPPAVGGLIRRVTAVTAGASGVVLLAVALTFHALGASRAEVLGFAVYLAAQITLGLESALTRGLHQIVRAVQHEQIIVPFAQAVALGLCLFRTDMTSVTLVLALQAACIIPSALWLGRHLYQAARLPHDRGVAFPVMSVLTESAPVVLNALVWRALADVPLWIAGAVIGSGGAALFGVAQRLAALLQLPLATVVSTLGPEMARAFDRRQYATIERRMRRGTTLATLAAAAGLVIIVVGGRQLLALVYGLALADALPVAIILGAAQLVNSACGLGGTSLLLMNESRRLLLLSLGSTTTLVVVSWPMAAVFGLPGLAWAWLGAFALQNALMVHLVYRKTGMRIWMTVR